ncbi:Hcp family type VI secretion system effector [Neolewinella litorea]|uniref:Type VI secretion system tube protein Hcp n=1 Tax=Neolewinella litorea TaxID=2562452 RepID=A0A4S4NDZ0_9BACT|nr:type VI secretion system tube protein Hcp [Neolewinella litorea]THH37699.1 type VI secretion system tube protein Hcp [Neolewinella litorea]
MFPLAFLRWGLPLLVLIAPLSLTAQSTNMYLDIPGIKGTSTTTGYENLIEIQDFSWNTETTVSDPSTGGPRDASRPSLCTIRLGKQVDISSPYLFKSAVLGEVHLQIKLQQVQLSQSGPSNVFVEYVLDNVIISLYDTGGVGTERGQEVIALSPSRIEMTVNEIDPATGAVGKTHTAYYDFETGNGG